MNKIEEYGFLIDGYKLGIYTQGEVVNKALELLFQSSNRYEFWKALASEDREKMTRLIKNFDESVEPFAINADSLQVWREMSALKQWIELSEDDSE